MGRPEDDVLYHPGIKMTSLVAREKASMVWRQVLDAYEILDSARTDGEQVAELWHASGIEDIRVERAEGPRGPVSYTHLTLPTSDLV